MDVRFPFLIAVVAMVLMAAPDQARAETTFRLAITAEPTARGNPYFVVATNPNFFFAIMYDALTQIDNDGSVVPWLAESWEPDSETSWIFHLRPGVRFSNGELFNAETVKTVFDMLRTDAAIGLSWHRGMRRYPRVDIIDPLTVRIHTDRPNALAPNYLSSLYMAAPDHLRAGSFQALVDEPIGTGPFMLERWGKGHSFFKAHRDSWIAPKVDRMEVFAVSDSSSRLQALMSGQVDVVTAVNPDQIGMIERAGHRAIQRNSTRILAWGLLSTDPESPFSDVRVRRAVNYAVNKEAITEVLLSGVVEPATQPAVPFALGYHPDLEAYPYDPARARALLADAGYEDGFTFLLESPSGTQPNDMAVLQQVAADLIDVKVHVEFRLLTFPQLVRATLQGELAGQALVTDFTNRFGDALTSFSLNSNHNCDGIKPWYCDQAITDMAKAAYGTFDLEARAAMARQVVKHYRDDAQSLFLFPIVGMDGVHKRVKRWETRNNQFLYHRIEIEN